ncbi:MAG TPA: tRNA pseudouridine(38-40) synthase TruA [Planctomycetes bacterium]|nr:tRNA pseudouridine(38-40) synthase TruA [Planctomycetota bacterium]
MRKLKLTLAYDGTAYAGWQRQPGEPTVQEVLEEALERVTGQPVRTLASGRTDAGVHAWGQVVGVTTATSLAADTLQRALNAQLPKDVVVREVSEVGVDFHPIRDVVKKHYRYVIHDGPVRDVFAWRYSWHYPRRLDEEAMDQAAQPLVGRHDFASFQSAGAPRSSTVRTVYHLQVKRATREWHDPVLIEIAADGFLYNMVRAIVGSLVEVGRGARPPEWITEVLAGRDRGRAGPTAPPQGLFLVEVSYRAADRCASPTSSPG